MQSAAGHSLMGVVPAWVGLAKMPGPKFFKEVEFARGADARPCCFLAVLGAYLDRALTREGDGCPPIKALGRFALP